MDLYYENYNRLNSDENTNGLSPLQSPYFQNLKIIVIIQILLILNRLVELISGALTISQGRLSTLNYDWGLLTIVAILLLSLRCLQKNTRLILYIVFIALDLLAGGAKLGYNLWVISDQLQTFSSLVQYTMISQINSYFLFLALGVMGIYRCNQARRESVSEYIPFKTVLI